MPKSEIDAPLELIKKGDALADQLDFLGVVELQSKRAGGHRRRQCGQRGAFLEHQRPQPGAFGEVGGGASDDPAPDDDQVGAFGR